MGAFAIPMRFLLVLGLALTGPGCAEYFGSRIRMASMDVRLPATTETDISNASADAARLVARIAKRHGLSLTPRDRPAPGSNIFIVPGYSGGPWPGQPDVDWNGPQWKLAIDRPGDLSDFVKCSYLPPRTGNVMMILFSTDYAYRMPVIAKPMWQDLNESVVRKYGAEAVIKKEDLR